MTLDVQDSQYESGGASKTITYLLFTASSTDIHLFTCCSHVMIMQPHGPQHKASRDISELIYFPPMVAAFTHSTFLHSHLSP